MLLEPFQLPFVQRGLVEVLLLALAGGLLGTWIVLRGLAFYAHGVGTAAFPGLVLADGVGFAPQLGALGAAAAFTLGVSGLARRGRTGYDGLTALVLVGALALGAILASDVYRSSASVESLLFGSLLVTGTDDLLFAGVAGALALAASALLGRRWLATGFDPAAAYGLGLRSAAPEAVLLGLIALATTAALATVGALLASAIFVVPAATARLWTTRMASWQMASVALAATEGTAGLWLSVQTNAPPGATIAVVSGAVFAVALAGRRLPLARGLAAAATGAVALALAGCGLGDGAGGRVRAVATTTQLGDLARAVGGDAVHVTQILHANSDPHQYEPRPRDILDTRRARVVFVSGDGLDDWMGRVLSESGGDPVVVDLAARVPVRRRGESGTTDPHWWHDPRNARAAVLAIRDALGRADPAQAAAFARNAAAYLRRLAALDRGIRACVGAVPAAERRLVTDHDAFGYFTDRYGIRVIGAVIPSQTTEAQPSAGDVARLARTIRREGVGAVFPERAPGKRLAAALARATGAAVGHALYGDALGPAGSAGATYLGMEAANADAIVRGLTGGRRGCAIAGIGAGA